MSALRFCLVGLLGFLLNSTAIFGQTPFLALSKKAFQNQQFDSALLYSNQAIQEFKRANQPDSLVLAYIHQADILWDTEGSHPALEIAKIGVETSSKLPDKHLVRVAALNKKAQLLVHMSRTEEAKLSFREAENRLPENDTINGIVASLFNNISWMYLNLNRYGEALRYAERSLEIQLKLYGEDARQLMGVYQSLGLIASGAGWFEDAEKYSLKLYDIATKNLPPGHPTMGLVHNQLVVVYESMSRFTDALFHLKAMVEVTQKAYAESGNPQFLAIAYNNTGFLYHQLGENSLAEAYFEKALKLHQFNYGVEEIGIVQPLAHLAEAKRSLEKFEEADSLFTLAYQLQSRFDKENIRGLADLESQIGGLNEDKANFEQAEKFYTKALERYQRSGIEDTYMVAETKTSLGKTYAKQGRTAEALVLHQEVLDAYRKKYEKGSLYIAGKFHRISETYRLRKNWKKALEYSDSTFLELLRLQGFPNSNWIQNLPISSDIADFLSNRIAILEGNTSDNVSKATLETIVKLVADYGIFLERNIPALRTQSAIVDLAKKQKKLYQSGINAAWLLSEKFGRTEYLETAFEFAERGKGLLLRLASNNLVVDEYATDESDLFSQDRLRRGKTSALNAQYLNSGGTNDTILNQLTQSIESYRIFQDSVLQLGDPKWAERFNLRPFSLAEIRKYLLSDSENLVEYAVTEAHIFTFLLNKDQFRVFRLPKEPIVQQVGILQNLAQLEVGEFVDAAFPLYQKLVQPILPFIKGDQLIIVPDGVLFGINFELLLTDNKGVKFSELKYLIRDFELSYLLSASSAVQQQKTTHRASKKGLFFAPGFTPGMKETYQARLLEKPEEDPIHAQLIRQPFSMQAAKQATLLLDGDLFLEENAQEHQFKRVAFDHQILHLGTHAEVNHRSPLQSRLFLAKSSISDTIQEDGILHAFEVYSMELQAELAVLSACNTGSGKFQEGEGTISLAHSFLHAGCSAVLMSMWAIDEKASATILTEFYRNLAKGKAKNTALRDAKLSFLENSPEELAHPYYWAGLGLIGDPSPISSKGINTYWIICGLIGLSIILIFGYRYFKKG